MRVEVLAWPADGAAVVSFLTANEWPSHGVCHLSPEAAAAVGVAGDYVATFWMLDGTERVGLIRLFDLDDLAVGSPLFDLRIAESHRGRGLGRRAVDWLTEYLFTTYPELYRIEATTRADNLAMQAVFAHCRYRQEGRLVEAWSNADGSRHDTLIYGFLRREWALQCSGLGATRGCETMLLRGDGRVGGACRPGGGWTCTL